MDQSYGAGKILKLILYPPFPNVVRRHFRCFEIDTIFGNVIFTKLQKNKKKKEKPLEKSFFRSDWNMASFLRSS